MNTVDKEYFRLLNLILNEGRVKHNRTGVDTIGVFGAQAKFDVNMNAFPVLTTKKVFTKGIIHELLWFIRGDTNIKYLVDNNVHIWDEWAYKKYNDYYTKLGYPKQVDSYYNRTHAKELECDADSLFTQYNQDRFIYRIQTDDNFAKKWGELGEGTYGGMWRAFPTNVINYDLPVVDTLPEQPSFKTVDQLQQVINKLKNNPNDRRIIVSAWHPYWVDHCALPPCHCLFHFNTEELTEAERVYLYEVKTKAGQWSPEALEKENIPKRRLNCLLYQRSCDTFLGVPFNITSYCLLTAMIAHCVNMAPGTFTHTYGDLHIYSNHLEQVNLQLTREPMTLPKLWLNPNKTDLFDFTFDDIRIENYQSHPAIKGEVAV